MTNWTTQKITKTVTEGEDVRVEFDYLGNKLIKNVDPHCGCTSYNWNGNILKVLIETDLVSHVLPKALYELKKEYYKNTSLDVYYEDGTKDKLEIELTVKEIPGRNG